MENIGKRIKELRRARDMTQERLAEYLNVSFQAISKWETGIAMPDLSMIAPLTKIFGVTSDELLGISHENEVDNRRSDLIGQRESTFETGDTTERLRISEIAVSEYPGDMQFLIWLADDEKSFATHVCSPYGTAPDPTAAKDYLEKSVHHYEIALETTEDKDLREFSLIGIVYALSSLGRLEEARRYAEQSEDPDSLLRACLTGDEAIVHHQHCLKGEVISLLFELVYGYSTHHDLDLADKLIRMIVDDGNYLWFHSYLMTINRFQARWFAREHNWDGVIDKLKECREHGIALDTLILKAKEKPFAYTCAAFDRLTFDGKVSVSGTETYAEEFLEYLRDPLFDPLRERDDFKELTRDLT